MEDEKESKKVNIRESLKEYWNFLEGNRKLFFILILAVILIQLLEVIPSFLYKYLIDSGTSFVSGDLGKDIFVKILLVIGGVYLTLGITQSFGNLIRTYYEQVLDSNIIIKLKQKYFSHIVGLDHKFHTTHKTGSLISRLNRGGGAIESLNDVIVFQLSPLIIQVIIVSASLIYFNFYSALIIFLLVLLFIGYSYTIQRIQIVARAKLNKADDYEKGKISDFFMNIESIKYFGKEEYVKKEFSHISKNTKERFLDFAKWFGWNDFGQNTILVIGTILLIYFPLRSFLAGETTLGTIVFIYTVYGNITGPMFSFVWGMRNFYRSLTDIQDLFEYGKIEKEIKDKPNARSLKITKGEIEFDNISFNYSKKKLFENFNLRISQNKKVAFVGHSGCGKTTLVKLLYRFYDVASGKVLVDGQNVKDIKQESLRSEMSIVPQEAILFDDTIYNNILFSNPSASRKEVMRAIKFAQLDKFIGGLPEKENTIVGERGVKLSGGEKQRVSIARAILANKKILILDEATSSLDSQTEFEIQRDLEKLMKGRTSIIIAHRLSTIMKADEIVVLEKGKIVQVGTHNQLINKTGTYKKLWNLQKGGYIGE
ncbi:MAG: ABC transporter ATP-binding protein [Candidatus Pacearchaeota archaeon]